jgi:hypothetical protein
MNRLEYLIDQHVFNNVELSQAQKDWMLQRLMFLYYPTQEVVEAAMAMPETSWSRDLQEAVDMLVVMEDEADNLTGQDPLPQNVYHLKGE